MKILCVIDHFGSGGAQRQMVNLGLGLKARGHEVEFFNYFPKHAFFRPAVEAAGIRIHDVPKGGGFSLAVLHTLVGLLRSGRYDAAISFLNTPNAYLEMASLVARPRVVIASERSSHLGDKSRWRTRFYRALHRAADAVVANSFAHAEWLETHHRWLRGKVRAVHNGIDLAAFMSPFDPPAKPAQTRLLAIGRVGAEKNVLGLIRAMRLFLDRHGWVPQVSWAGRADTSAAGCAYLQRIEAALAADSAIRGKLIFLGERADVPGLLSTHHALILPSFYEGLPNVVCEALAAGKPVIASEVSDVAMLVEHGQRGFIFNPNDPQAITHAMEQITGLMPEQWRAFSAACNAYAAEHLSTDKMVESFENILLEISSGKKVDVR